MQYIPYFVTHPEEYEPREYGIDHIGDPTIPNATCSKEGLQSLYRFEVVSEDEYEIDDKQELCRRMVEKFKASKCYKYKTEEERREIIEYLLSHPERG